MGDITPDTVEAPVKTKAKRVLSDEQKAKMLEGRRKAAEIKKAQKAILKNEKIKEKENDKKQKVKNKELELQAIQQQKDRIEVLNISKKKKSEMRGRLRFCKNNPELIGEVEEMIQAIENKNNEKKNIDLEIKEIQLEINDKKQELTEDEENEVYKKVWDKEAKRIELTIPEESRSIFRAETEKFDFNLSLSDNINKMIKNVEAKIQSNTAIVSAVNAEINETEDVINRNKELIQEKEKQDRNKRINSKLQMLYSLR
tara:strand:+ start:6500 stop:7270 length:771 start_codon:yes stop_codon:yes gene_type:complete